MVCVIHLSARSGRRDRARPTAHRPRDCDSRRGAGCSRHPSPFASLVVDNLIQANRRGVHTHGIARVSIYVRVLGTGATTPGRARRSSTKRRCELLEPEPCPQATHDGGGRRSRCHAGQGRGVSHLGRAQLQPVRLRRTLGSPRRRPGSRRNGVHDRRSAGHPDRWRETRTRYQPDRIRREIQACRRSSSTCQPPPSPWESSSLRIGRATT